MIYFIFLSILLLGLSVYLYWDRTRLVDQIQKKDAQLLDLESQIRKSEELDSLAQKKAEQVFESIKEVLPHYLNIKKEIAMSGFHVESVANNLQTSSNDLVAHFSGILVNIEKMIESVLKVTDKAEGELLSFVSDDGQPKKFRIQADGEGSLGNQEFIQYIQKKYNDLLQRIIDELVITHKRKEEDIKTLDLIYQRVHGIITFSEEITDIAGGIELISLNANIEAAHAGSAGKGFTVVANEIRRLANLSEEAAARIKREIKETNEFIKVSISSIKDAMDAESKYLNSTIAIIQDVFFAMTKTLFHLIFELTITLMNSMGSSSKIKEEVDNAIRAMQLDKYIFELSETTTATLQRIMKEIDTTSIDSLEKLEKLNIASKEEFDLYRLKLKEIENQAKEEFKIHEDETSSDDVVFF